MVARFRGESAAESLLGLRFLIPPGVWMSAIFERCAGRLRSLGQADHSSRGVLPTVVCLGVIVNPGQ